MPHQTAVALPASPYTAGQLDKRFACTGKTQVYFAGSTYSIANSVAIDAQGRVLVAAKVGTRSGHYFGLARLLADGSADLSFGAHGSVIGPFQRGHEAMAGSVQVLANGNILLAGLHYEDAHRTLPALALFDEQGRPVHGFGDKGYSVIRLPGNLSQGRRDASGPFGRPGAETCAVKVQADGAILLLANHYFEQADHAGLLIRLNAMGELDTTFNGRGFVMVRHVLMNSWLSSLMLQADGRIMVGGSISFPEQALLARYLSDGSLDERFAVDGLMTFDIQGKSAHISQIVQLENGDLQCFGSSREPMHCLTLKVHSNGRPDIHCNNGQPHLLHIGRNASQWNAAQLQPDGRVLAVGGTLDGVEAGFLLARYLPTGQPDPGFAEGTCWVRTPLGLSLDMATSVAVQTDGGIVVGGYSLDGNYRAVVVRYLS
jgi:uncharacterized delta-60 repeat protein